MPQDEAPAMTAEVGVEHYYLEVCTVSLHCVWKRNDRECYLFGDCSFGFRVCVGGRRKTICT